MLFTAREGWAYSKSQMHGVACGYLFIVAGLFFMMAECMAGLEEA